MGEGFNGPAALVPLAELMPGHPPPVARRPEVPVGAVTLCFGGDVMLGRRVARDFPAEGSGPLVPLSAALGSADWTMVNLECPLSEPSAAVPFAAHPSSADWLKVAGIDTVSLANNHAGDAGAEGLESTRHALQTRGLTFADDFTGALKVTVKGLRLWILAWHDDGETPPPPSAMDALEAAAREGYWPIIFAHWGTEHTHSPDSRQRSIAREFVTRGARLIVGAGPHTVQRMEDAGPAVVAWSLGNLVFDGPGPDADWRRGALLRITVDPATGRIRQRSLLEVPVAGVSAR